MRRASECSKLSEPFCGRQEDENVERHAEGGGLAPEAAERSKHSSGLLCGKSVVSGQLELKSRLWLNKRPEPLNGNLCFAGTLDAGQLGLRC